MPEIAIWCTKCGEHTDASKANKEGVCRDCIVRDLTKEDRDLLIRILKRHRRYELNKVRMGKGGNDQLHKVTRRIITKIRMYAPWATADQITKVLNEIRVEAEGVVVAKRTIVVARTGDVARATEDLTVAQGILHERENIGVRTGGRLVMPDGREIHGRT